MLDQHNLAHLCEVAVGAAQEAGKHIQLQFDKAHQRMQKQAGSSEASQIVTEVDLRAQEIILSHLQPTIQSFNLGLLTEESIDNQSRLEQPYFWCVDPLDGTLPYAEGESGYAVSIALVSKSGDPIVSVVYIPDSLECFTAIKGSGVQLNGKEFCRHEQHDSYFHFYLDRSFKTEAYFDQVAAHLNQWALDKEMECQMHVGHGSVRNAINVMSTSSACYFKFPKVTEGGGCIWDFAATRLLFEELSLYVSNAAGEQLFLNNPSTTFMNDVGVIYTTLPDVPELIIEMKKRLGLL
ncbi:MAG: inositol monophosphatase [Cyclobacteriaceae bacterium]